MDEEALNDVLHCKRTGSKHIPCLMLGPWIPRSNALRLLFLCGIPYLSESDSILRLLMTPSRCCYRAIMSSLRGPVPIHFTGTPTRFSMNSTYSLAFAGKSSQFLQPVVLVSQPPRVSYFISSFVFAEISSSLCKSAGKVSSSVPSASTYAVATLISLKPSRMLVRR